MQYFEKVSGFSLSMASKPCFLQEMDNFTLLENSTIYVQGLAPFAINGFPDENPPNAVNNFHHFDLPMSSESASNFAGNAREESRILSAGNTPLSRENTGGLGGRKRRKEDPQRENEGKTREVVHVRAKRGQATDNHSLAERIRREKINQRLKSLQDLVPGCYKTMGMAVMLDVIIGYVQSLQNQIEFLSLKLSAASRYYDFNISSDVDPSETLQGTNRYEMQEMERVAAVEGYGGLSSVHSTLPF